MQPRFPTPPSSQRIAAELLRLAPGYAATPLYGLAPLAARLGVGQVLLKDESRRALGSFKSLGGTFAALRALARATGRDDLQDVAALVASRPSGLPGLVCASDGNHGLAVAAAGELTGVTVRVYLHRQVAPGRAARIAARGAEIVRVDGTYDDAVAAAVEDSEQGRSLLVADTADDPDDPVVGDVMAGYGVMAAEIRQQAEAQRLPPATHVFVPAGVGGLAAALAEGLASWLAPPAAVVAVEPAAARCVGAALAAGQPVQVDGELRTAAAMLSCGRASAPALEVLRRHGVRAVSVGEEALLEAPRLLRAESGPDTTPSGAAGLAGVLAALTDPAERAGVRLGPESRLLVPVTEGPDGTEAS